MAEVNAIFREGRADFWTMNASLFSRETLCIAMLLMLYVSQVSYIQELSSQLLSLEVLFQMD